MHPNTKVEKPHVLARRPTHTTHTGSGLGHEVVRNESNKVNRFRDVDACGLAFVDPFPFPHIGLFDHIPSGGELQSDVSFLCMRNIACTVNVVQRSLVAALATSIESGPARDWSIHPGTHLPLRDLQLDRDGQATVFQNIGEENGRLDVLRTRTFSDDHTLLSHAEAVLRKCSSMSAFISENLPESVADTSMETGSTAADASIAIEGAQEYARAVTVA